MQPTEEYFTKTRRQLEHDVNEIENDISLIQNDELRQIARELWLGRMYRIIELDQSILRGGEDDGMGGREDTAN